ncbi:MAG: hypothetical protein KJO07_10440 [Deltaproteobacteria bacterium]|jgi:hypothetical protein|nr:hypothetical protein [Deltaproteobacteria bacterium]
MAKKHRRKLSNFLLNKELQLRYVAVVTALSAIISGSLGFLIWRQGAKASDSIRRILDLNEVTRNSPELKAEILETLASSDSNLVVVMSLFGIGLVVVLSLYLIVLTHKIAGPLYKVTLYFDKMARGRIDQVYKLREGDMLQDFYLEFQAAHEAIRARHKETREALGQFLAACDSAGVSSDGAAKEPLEKLQTFTAEREEALA